MITKHRSKQKQTGARYTAFRKKRKYEKASMPTLTKLGVVSKTYSRKRAGSVKERLLSADTINLYDPKTKKYSKVKIKNIIENPANPRFVRRNIMTKGSVVETDSGKAKITSRPGQEGSLNGVLI